MAEIIGIGILMLISVTFVPFGFRDFRRVLPEK